MSYLEDAKTSRLGLHLLSVPSQIRPQTESIDIKKKSTEFKKNKKLCTTFYEDNPS